MVNAHASRMGTGSFETLAILVATALTTTTTMTGTRWRGLS